MALKSTVALTARPSARAASSAEPQLRMKRNACMVGLSRKGMGSTLPAASLACAVYAGSKMARRAQPERSRPGRGKIEVQNFENLPYKYKSMPLSQTLSTGQDFGFPGPVLVRQPAAVTLVDCGSGSTRALFFRDDGKSHVCWEKSTWRGEALATALQDELRLENLLRLLQQELPEGAVLLGATAGVREAVQDGSLDRSKVRHFEERVKACLGSRAQFMVLSGEEEARAEWEALQHALAFTPGLQIGLFNGMMSGGGMSCQLAVQADDAGLSLFSFRNGVLAPGGLADAAQRNSLLSGELEVRLGEARTIARKQVAELPKQLEGSFALVEWLGLYVAGESTERDLLMGLGYNRWLKQQDILQAVNEHLTSLGRQFLKGSVPIPRRVAISWLYGIILQEILEHCFDKDASFFCLKGINWSTGHYLQHRGALQQELVLQTQ